eukprot:TRINITY_DN8624_c0_g1_i1.p1 TRINITY_DN8624_c0_g1~~TRINITY_DN8624_c0_g1_i1.p1  ORF type:complete len:306 (-),score=56.59 TRINITY_DN8624_c0_g1_i1:28-894(-)
MKVSSLLFLTLLCTLFASSYAKNCLGCQVVVQLLQDEISESIPSTDVCQDQKIPSWLRSTCEDFIDQLKKAIEDGVEDYSPSSVCTQIGQCDSKKEERALANVDEQFNVLCTGCELIVTYVTSEEGKNVTVDQISELLNKACSKLPGFIKGTCHTIVDKYSDVMVQYIFQKYTAAQVCEKIKLCPASLAIEKEFALHSFRKRGLAATETECQSCQWMVSAIEAYASEDQSASSFAQFLEELCTLLPNQYTFVCQDFVNVYITEILQYLMESLPPPVVCERLTLCEYSN